VRQREEREVGEKGRKARVFFVKSSLSFPENVKIVFKLQKCITNYRKFQQFQDQFC
jgi:hypothetical protein